MVTTSTTPTGSSAPVAQKWVYLFREGNASMRDLLGGKGAGCAEMTRAGLPVPPGFTVTTEACNTYYALGKTLPEGLWDQVGSALADVEKQTGKVFGDVSNPLLVSVRSGAKFSMPGMMDTVLNLGLNDETAKGLISITRDPRFVYDAYRRFIQMFSKVVLELDAAKFEDLLTEAKAHANVKSDPELSADQLKALVGQFLDLVQHDSGHAFPVDPLDQLRLAIMAVFRSWNNDRALVYRRREKISDSLGTAVNVQTMVFGNAGDDSGTGVAFTRNPSNGDKKLFGEYLFNAQGEDVVAGIRTAEPIAQLERDAPAVYQQFRAIAERMERHYRDVQDLEFTIEHGKLFMLQTRAAKRSAQAAVKIAVDMVHEGIITEQEALQRVTPEQVVQLLLPRFDEKAKAQAVKEGRLLATGLNASPGAAAGLAVFSADEAADRGKRGEAVVLVRPETSQEDLHGMIEAKGILTAVGGATSHAAVVARGFGIPCVAGASGIRVSERDRAFYAGGTTVRELDPVSIDGATGEVFAGTIPTVDPDVSDPDLQALLAWADTVKRLGVWANADYPADAKRARDFGAKGIGLCRTEHMFQQQDRLPVVRRMILAADAAERQQALDELLPVQRGDFEGILEAMEGLPVVIRLIDPPLHEFLPSREDLIVEVALLKERKADPALIAEREKLLQSVNDMHELNPMLGLRGCRLGLTFPEINVMQTRAILEAAAKLRKRGVDAHPKIMIPLVGHVNELKVVREQLEKVAGDVERETGGSIDYKFGTMIELPRAALTAEQIAGVADFFSFGTNDLTQTTFGFSRDDAEGKFLLRYVDQKILPFNPFQTIDRDGVGQLVAMAVANGRKANPGLEVGICGEHGGDPESVEFFHQANLDYVSCSPFRVPVARLAAAQAALASKTERDR
jgi:pyruvate,orthophosphate dikinase